MKSIRVLSGTGTAGVKQVNILPNVTGPSGAFQQASQLNGFTGPTGTFQNVQNANVLTAGLKSIIINGYVSPTGGTGASPFTPLSLTGLIAWLDLSVAASVNLTANRINSITDQSPNALVANWTGNNKPVYNATGFNTSYPAMTDDTTTVAGVVQITSFPMGTGNTLTCWLVGKNSGLPGGISTNNFGRFLSYAKPASADQDNTGSWCVNNDGGTFTHINFTRNSSAGSVLAPVTSPFIIIITVDSSGAQTFYINGAAGVAGATIPGNWVSGGTFSFGDKAGFGSDYWDGVLAEGGVCTGWHNATTVASLYTYLKTKWGL